MKREQVDKINEKLKELIEIYEQLIVVQDNIIIYRKKGEQLVTLRDKLKTELKELGYED